MDITVPEFWRDLKNASTLYNFPDSLHCTYIHIGIDQINQFQRPTVYFKWLFIISLNKTKILTYSWSFESSLALGSMDSNHTLRERQTDRQRKKHFYQNLWKSSFQTKLMKLSYFVVKRVCTIFVRLKVYIWTRPWWNSSLKKIFASNYTVLENE